MEHRPRVTEDGGDVVPRPDWPALRGGRSGQQVPSLTAPPGSAVRAATPGRVFVPDEQGRVVLDLTRERAKEVLPGRGFSAKRQPTAREHMLMDKVASPGAG